MTQSVWICLDLSGTFWGYWTGECVPADRGDTNTPSAWKSL